MTSFIYSKKEDEREHPIQLSESAIKIKFLLTFPSKKEKKDMDLDGLINDFFSCLEVSHKEPHLTKESMVEM